MISLEAEPMQAASVHVISVQEIPGVEKYSREPWTCILTLFRGKLCFCPTPLSPDPVTPSPQSPPNNGSSPWDDHNHANKLFKTQSMDLPCGDISPAFLPQYHPGVALLCLLNLVLLIWFDLDYCVGGEA